MTDQKTKPRSVIVISSHVVRGAVGNRAVVLALEMMGYPVWAVPSVILPWHPGHGPGTRIVAPATQFADMMRDIGNAPWLDEVGAVLSGYLGDAEQAGAVAALVASVKARNPDALYLCDPVMGDAGGLYAPEATAQAMKTLLLPMADIATPNRYELEWLAEETLADNGAIISAATALGPRSVLVTSAHAMLNGSIGNLLVTPDEALLAEHRVIASPPNGTGDLLSALFLAHYMQGLNPEKALRMAVAAVFEVIAHSVRHGADELMLEANARSLFHPMAMVQTRHLVQPRRSQAI